MQLPYMIHFMTVSKDNELELYTEQSTKDNELELYTGPTDVETEARNAVVA